jgi:sugar phosphate isomerase/epimerase
MPEAAKRAEAVAEAIRHIEIAEKVGASFVRVFGGNAPEGEPREKWVKIVAESLRTIGAAAAKKKVIVALETHDSWRKSTEIMPIIKMVNMDNVRIVWDLAHPFTAGESMEDSAAAFAGYAVHVHIKDHTADNKLVLLGQGIIPLDRAFVALKKMKYDGYVSLEWEKMWHPEIEDPEVAFPQAISYMRRLDSET